MLRLSTLKREILMANSNFWRASAPALTFVDGIPSDSQNVEERLLKRLAIGHGVLAGEYSEEGNRAQIAWIGAVVGVSSTESHLTVFGNLKTLR
jgi:hypothetical protein